MPPDAGRAPRSHSIRRRPDRSTAARGATRGFTILELLIVLAVLAAVYALAVPTRPAAWLGGDVAGAARALGHGLRAARAEAVAARRPVSFVIEPARLAYGAGRATATLPARDVERFEVQVAASQQAGGRRLIRFFPDGSATGGRVVLAHGGRQATVEVDWLTGRVRVGAP